MLGREILSLYLFTAANPAMDVTIGIVFCNNMVINSFIVNCGLIV